MGGGSIHRVRVHRLGGGGAGEQGNKQEKAEHAKVKIVDNNGSEEEVYERGKRRRSKCPVVWERAARAGGGSTGGCAGFYRAHCKCYT